MQQKAYEKLFSEFFFTQKTVRDPQPIRNNPENKCTHQFILLNPLKDTKGKREKNNIREIFATTIEQDCMSKNLQSIWFRNFFPNGATVENDSGGKSIHHHIRFLDSIDEKDHKNLVSLLKRAFPFSDHAVVSNKACLVRNPGGTRDNGKEQKILYIGERIDHAKVIMDLYREVGHIKKDVCSNARSCMVNLYKGKNLDDINSISKGIAEMMKAGYLFKEDSLCYTAFLENFTKNQMPEKFLKDCIKDAIEINKQQSKKRHSNYHSDLTTRKIHKYSRDIQDGLSQIDLFEIMVRYAGLDASSVVYRDGGKKSVKCPFHDDKSPSAWISTSPSSSVEYFFCSSDTCAYNKNIVKGLNAIKVLEACGHSFDEACRILFAKYNMDDVPENLENFVEDEPEGDTKFQDFEIEEYDRAVNSLIPATPKPKNKLVYTQVKDMLDQWDKERAHDCALGGKWKYTVFSMEAAQGSGKSHTSAQVCFERFRAGLSTIYCTRSHDELRQMYKRLSLMFADNGLDINKLYHLKGKSKQNEEIAEEERKYSSIPDARPIIILMPHVYLKRKGHTLYHFPIVQKIIDQEFGQNILLIIDEVPSFINGLGISIPLGSRYGKRNLHNYELNVKYTKCPFGTNSSNCTNCHKKDLIVPRLRTGVLSYEQYPTHREGDRADFEEIPDLPIVDDKKKEVNTMVFTPINRDLDGMMEREWSTGGKKDKQLEVSFVGYIKDLLKTTISPHIVEFFPYDFSEEINYGRPLTEEEVEDIKENGRGNIVFPSQVCDVKFLQGWDALTLLGIKDFCDILMLGPELSDQHRLFLSQTFGGYEEEWELEQEEK